MEDLLYTISKVKLLEDILMPQPIVPVEYSIISSFWF